MAYTTLVAGQTITASWANASVRDQVISPFSDSAARSSAITSPVNGMVSYLTSTDRLDVYNGSSWSALVAPSNGAWTSWTPTLTQSGAVTATVTRGSYIRVGRMIAGEMKLDVTGTGTAANNVTISLPVTRPAGGNECIGVLAVFDSSASLWYHGVLLGSSTTAVAVANGFANPLGQSSFTAALASGDIVTAAFKYEASADA